MLYFIVYVDDVLI